MTDVELLNDPPRQTRPWKGPGARSRQRATRNALVILGDLLALFMAAACAYSLWARPVRSQPIEQYLQLAPLLLFFVVGYAAVGLYPGFGIGGVETLRRLTYVTTAGFLAVATFTFALQVPHRYSRVTFALSYVLSVLFVPTARLLLLNWARRFDWWAEPVVVVGTGQRATRAIRNTLKAAHLGYRPVAVLTLEDQKSVATVETVPVAGDLQLGASFASAGVRVALLETDQFQDRDLVDRLQQHFHHVVLLREFDDLPIQGIHIRNLGGSMVGFEYTNNLLLFGNQTLKRTMDLVIASVSLVVFGPIILMAATLVKILDRGPAFYFQKRSGLGGRDVAVPKIRTMRVDAEKILEEHLRAHPALRDEWQARFKLRHDPRLIPFIGRLFRRLSIDELPQLFSVVVGDMSLVGPRPLPDYHLRSFPPRFLTLRQRVRPGITGLWQIMVRSEGGLDEQEGYDTHYIRNWSVWLDLYVLAKTVGVVFSGRGAY